MESISIAYWLGAGHLAFVLVAFALTARPLISTYHWFLLVSFIAFGLRPILAASVGGFTNYESGIAWYAYNLGLLYQLIFMLCFSAAYIAMFSAHRLRMRPLASVPGPKAFYVLFACGLVALCILQMISGGAWLPGNRTGTINSAVPGGKYIFPFAVMSFSLLIPLGVIGYMRKTGVKRSVVVLAALVSLAALSLLFMRGMVVTGVLLILWAADKAGNVKPKHVVIGLMAVFLIGQLLRPVGRYAASWYLTGEGDFGVIAAGSGERTSLADKAKSIFLFTTNMDFADSWPVVIDYADHEGLLYGRSFLAVPARFASTKFRVDTGLTTASDRVNEFFYGSDYADTSFGLNVTLPDELFLNFGVAGLLLGILPGLATWAADRWLFRVPSVGPLGMFVAFICFRGFTNELATAVQWAVGAILLALVVEGLVRMRTGRRHRRANVCVPRETELTKT